MAHEGSPLGGSWGRKSSPWWFLDWLAFSYYIITNGFMIIMMSQKDIALVKEHEVYKYFTEVLDFPEDMAVELTFDVLVTS